MCIDAHGCRGQKRVSDLTHVELSAIVSLLTWVLGMKFGSFTQIENTISY